MSTEIQQKLAAAHKQWKQEHDTVVQETVKQALAKVKHEYESMYAFARTHARTHTYTYAHTYTFSCISSIVDCYCRITHTNEKQFRAGVLH